MACNDAKKKLLLDEFANAFIKLSTLSRSTQASHSRINQEVSNEVFKMIRLWPKYYYSGSLSEGMHYNGCGDTDIMVTMRDFPIVLFDSEVSTDQYTRGYVMAEHNTDEPSYLMLKAVRKDGLHDNIRAIVDTDGYLKTAQFIEFNWKSMKMNEYSKLHGPSVTYINYFSNGFGFEKTMTDFVYCLKCQSWPTVATNFFTRHRPGIWPSRELLNRVSHLECLVVPVGHPGNSAMKPEWRLSFSMAEKELIHHMPEPYLDCMYALKSLKNKYIVYSEFDKPTPFCSYFIKTACLWMCETFPHEGYSIMDLITKTIDWLIHSYRRKNLPNYFISEQNLIGYLSRDHCNDVIAKLKAAKKNLWKMVVSSVGMFFFVRDWIIHPICDKLNITRINEDDDYTDLETSLMKHPRGTDILNDAIQDLIPRGEMHELYGNVENSMCIANTFPDFIMATHVLIKLNVEKLSILNFPEQVFMPIIQNIDNITSEGNASLFKQRLYRFLGDIYTYLLIYLRKTGKSLCPQSVYCSKPLYYYGLATKNQHPEKWSDCRMAGDVSVVVHHYLMDNYQELKEKLIILIPKLRNINENLIAMSRQINISIQTNCSLVTDGWATDEILHHFASKTELCFFINPVVFVFYVNARVCLRDGDIDNARIMVKEIETCLKLIFVGEGSTSTRLLIKIVQSLIGLLEVALMIYSGAYFERGQDGCASFSLLESEKNHKRKMKERKEEKKRKKGK